jgi:hypothetical protein
LCRYTPGDRTLSEQFNTWKDVVIPGLEPEREFWSGALRTREPKETKYAGYFRGTIHNKGGKSYSKGIRIKMEDRVRGDPEVVFSEVRRKPIIFHCLQASTRLLFYLPPPLKQPHEIPH